MKKFMIFVAISMCLSACGQFDNTTAEDFVAAYFDDMIAKEPMSDKQKDAARSCFEQEKLPALIEKLDAPIQKLDMSDFTGGPSGPQTTTLRQLIDKMLEIQRSDPEANVSIIGMEIDRALMLPMMDASSCVRGQVF